jgi:C1A family cysteine protease
VTCTSAIHALLVCIERITQNDRSHAVSEHRQIQRLGWKPSLPDQRDLVADTSEIPVADEVDPRADLPAVYDQLHLGSCTANAVAAALQYNDMLDGNDYGTPSRLFIYYFERRLEGSPASEDTGAYGRDGFKVAARWGTPPESEWPYSDDNPGPFQQEPPQPVMDLAAQHKLREKYRSVPRSVDAFKAVLSNRQTCAFGFTVYESFMSAEVAKSGVVPLPARRERQVGGHEVLMVGYLAAEPNYALVRNSWGADWGMGGYCLFPWAYILSPLASDFRTIRRAVGQ